MTDEEMAKLPKWAQRKVQLLMANLRSAEAKCERMLGEYDPKYPAYGDYDDLRGKSLPCRTVYFPEAGINVKADGSGILIRAAGQLSIEPHVTNVLLLKSDRKWD